MPVVKTFVGRLYQALYQHRIFLIAAGVAFYALLAIFPAVAALISLYGLFADPKAIPQHVAALQGFLPQQALDIVGGQVERIVAQGRGTLGLVFFTTLGISLWSAMAGIKGLFDALNIVYGTEERRSFLDYNLQALVFILGAIVFCVLAMAGIVAVPVVLASVGLADQTGWLIGSLRWPVLYLVLVALLAILYRFGPCRPRPDWRWVIVGSAVAAGLWLLSSMLFSWYVATLANYNATYGSLGTVIAFMTWIWLSAMSVLIGAEVDAALEHSRGSAALK